VKQKTILITSSSGLIGSAAVEHFDRQGHEVFGVDNNMRRIFFGQGDTLWNLERLKAAIKRFTHAALDIRDRAAIEELFRTHRLDLIVHCATQPSHDKARDIPLLNFEVNALGTVNFLEATCQHSPEAVFVFLITNKVYGDAPNEIPLKEVRKALRLRAARRFCGGRRNLPDRSQAAFAVRRFEGGGCQTGPSHSGVERHGFLSYLVKVTLRGGTYSILGYKGKQVRNNIHSYDVVRAVEEFAANQKPGEVYNLGGGRENSISILEAIERIEQMTGRKLDRRYVEEARKGDHICYISNLGKFKKDYPVGRSRVDWTRSSKRSLRRSGRNWRKPR
jgi:CDP-paratose 2-epimerase